MYHTVYLPSHDDLAVISDMLQIMYADSKMDFWRKELHKACICWEACLMYWFFIVGFIKLFKRKQYAAVSSNIFTLETFFFQHADTCCIWKQSLWCLEKSINFSPWAIWGIIVLNVKGRIWAVSYKSTRHSVSDVSMCPWNVALAEDLMADEYLFRDHECWQPLHVQRVRGWKWLALRGLDNLCPPSSRFRSCNCHWPMGSRLKLDPGLQPLTSPSERILFWFLMLL